MARDQVDRIVEAWERERPDLDTEPMQVLSRLSRLARHLDKRRREAFAQARADGAGLELWEFDVLAALRRTGQPYELSPTELMAETLVTSGTMTTRVEKLAARGLVERRRRETGDRRGVRVVLTAEGRRAADAALEALLEHERELLAGLSPADQEQLAALLRVLVQPFDGAIE
ncbi:MAG TPA: MarR family winged helix-turn-helix transcriptional regulator [Jiangellaceae bacterium]|nr:MarR family winged helix-turn-helix transcriptional regulator [Jiangellaceae bacterium]